MPKSKVKIGAGLRVWPVSLRPANGSRSDGGQDGWKRPWQRGHGRGPPGSEEERWGARQVNAARAAEGLATKSTGSVSRSKARALAHRAAVDSKVIPGEAIEPPAILPPPPPKAPTQEPVVLREAQPLSGGKSPQYSGPSVPVVLTEAPQAKGKTVVSIGSVHRGDTNYFGVRLLPII